MANPAYLSPDEMAERIVELEAELASAQDRIDRAIARLDKPVSHTADFFEVRAILKGGNE